jgi:hypothetical protein
MIENDLDRYRRRITEEERKAADPENHSVRHVHEQLAALYRERLESARQAMPQIHQSAAG